MLTRSYNFFYTFCDVPNYFMKLWTKSLVKFHGAHKSKYVNSWNYLLKKELFLWEKGLIVAHNTWK